MFKKFMIMMFSYIETTGFIGIRSFSYVSKEWKYEF
ncbi:hypothetical protein EDF67_101391 [Sphingobacterium sp. JUb78]|nr:hypothetical protein [Sphingobacterium sp. JUb56]MCW2259264.1 hypothetical protein [Sphingobacterium kitahiroshimense]TCR14287.1 hypothetical protein EDF67_101391 [Sphingobacterium sp. JUb78]